MNKLKKLIAIILCFIMVTGSFAFAEEIKLISADVRDYEGHWAQSTIQKWVDGGKMSGYPDGSFKPDGNITRAEFVKLVNSLIDYDTKGKITFEDVNQGDWFYDLVSIANEIGYITGYSEKQFGPNDNITREQAASILSRIQYLEENYDGVEKYSDKSSISSWALGGVGAASLEGFISGYNDGSFKPTNNLTRAEAVTMLDNALTNAKNHVIYKSGSQLKNMVIDGDLIIAKTVGDGDVYLENLDIKGQLKVYGGGENSLYFNNIKVNKIIVEKDKVRLILDDGTVINEVAIGKDAVLENKNAEVAKVTITSDGKVTLSGNFEEVVVEGNTDIVLNNAKIEILTVEKPIVISGTGTIVKLEANSDGIKYEAKVTINDTVLGKGVTEKPAKTEGSTPTPGGSNSGGNTPSEIKYSISASAKLKDSEGIISEIPYTTKYYTKEKDVYTVIKDEISSLKTKLNAGDYDELLNLDQVEEKFAGIENKEELWDRMIIKLDGTSILSGIEGLKNELLDGEITIATDIVPVLDLYTDTYNTSSKAYADLDVIISTLNDSDLTLDAATYEVKYKSVDYTDKADIENLIKNTILSSISDKASDNKITLAEFKEIFGTEFTLEVTRGEFTTTLTIKINEL